jgi:hypothetical protein
MKTNRLASTFAVTILLAGTGIVAREARAQAGPYQYFAITPCRIYDSRTGQPSALGTGGGAITTTLNNATGFRPLRVRGGCGVPNTAQAVTVNHTVTNSTVLGQGSVGRMCPNPLGGGQTVCRAWVLYGPGETISNGGILPLGVVGNPGTDNDIQLQGIGADATGHPGVFTYDWIIDITGYFQ